MARLRTLQRRVPRVLSLTELYGVEGDGAAQYFAAFPSLLAPHLQDTVARRFPKRQRRPGRDPLNASLNYAYGLLVSDAVRALVACRLVRLRTELARMIDTSDSVLVVDLGLVANLTPARFSYIGRQRPITPSGPLVL